MTFKIRQSKSSAVLKLSGRIEAEHVCELQRLLGSNSCVVLDLEELKLVDRDVVQFLARLESNGTKIKNCPEYIREWILREIEKQR